MNTDVREIVHFSRGCAHLPEQYRTPQDCLEQAPFTPEVIELGSPCAHLRLQQEMTMIALLLYRTVADHLLPWATTLATRMLARSLNVPEPLVHSTGDYVVAQVTAFEHSVGRSLCPFRLARLLRAWWRGLH
jgi:hypothetical protein